MKPTLPTATLLTACILAATACLGGGDDQPAPLPEEGTSHSAPIPREVLADPELLITLRLLNEQIMALSEQLQQATPAPEATEPAPTPTQSPASLSAPEGTGICRRSPAIQKIILETLRIPYCRPVTHQELYRITNLQGSAISADSLQAGDLSGLVNLEELTVSGEYPAPLPAGTFEGSAINSLTLSGVRPDPGAFDGMIALDSLTVTDMPHIPPLSAEVFSNLHTLRVDLQSYNNRRDLPPSTPPTSAQFLHLKSLKHLYIRDATRLGRGTISGANWRADDNPAFTLPSDLFKNNPELTTIQVQYHHYDTDDGTRYRLYLPNDLLARLEHIAAVSFHSDPSNIVIENQTHGEAPLQISSVSPLGRYLSPPTRLPDDWTSTQRYRDLSNWYDWEGGGSLRAAVPKDPD